MDDVIQSIKRWIKQNFCIHDYRPTYYDGQRCYRQCIKCGFEGYNPITGNSILQIHHLDGDASNNSESNL